MPGKARFDLLEADVTAVAKDFADYSAVLVALLPFNLYLLACNKFAEILAGDITERLSFFRRIDPLQSDTEIGVLCVENINRVTVDDAYHRSD
jgi:hypothetical protein